MLLGLALGGVGYAILHPGGLEGRIPDPAGRLRDPAVHGGRGGDGPGAIIFIAALMPKGPGGSGGGGKKRRKGSAPITVDFTDSAPMAAHDHGSTHAHHEAQVVAAAPEPVAVAEAAPEPEVHSGAPPGARSLRRGQAGAPRPHQGRTLVRSRRQCPAAFVVGGDDHERRIAAQDAGDFARAQGLTDQAADAYDEALTYARQIGEPAALADALTNVGDVAYEEQRLDTAVDAYEEALALRRTFVQGKPADLAGKRALSLALERLADAREDRGHRTRALDLYKQSLDISEALASADPVAYGEDLAVTRRRLAELEAKVLA
uniref:Tetratricopeptide repeat protein n=1 Tax=Phenylobacterium glaciei TaxID=2803784 RepID=A0A974P2I2_9CAUL|nr:tetratricopeptide repeat protein [Phenylobacterium glaciei]